MGRSFPPLIGLLLLLPSLFGLLIFETFYPIEPCHPKKVCVNFVHDECENSTRNSDRFANSFHSAMIWEQPGKCKLEYTNTMYAAVEFELHDLYTWSVLVTSYRYPVEIGFSFANATIKFYNDTTAEFEWFSRGVREWFSRLWKARNTGKYRISLIPALVYGRVETGRWHYNLERRLFNISADGEKLITILGGPGMLYTSKVLEKDEYFNPKELELSDKRFLEKLEENTFCNFSEIIEKCYDNCDQLKDVNKTVYCSSQMWYHNPSRPVTVLSLRDWKKVEAIECRMGSWWLGDSNTMVDYSLEVQCSKDEPAKMTATTKQILGTRIWHWRTATPPDDWPKDSTKRSSESTKKDNKSEYFFKKSDKHAKSTDREGKNTDRHTKSSTRAVGRSPDSPGTPSPKGAGAAAIRRPKLLQEPKGAENAARPPLPEGFVSESLA
ncbi:hypothetical protein PRIPAC_94691 [Pristionchus pacificus]|uniref:Uncharacterized protein n=1 Tax=Pristionchus pacificus TaxID=54126 RepID=A0A2A6BPG0_PRIPA|nr:hypothetical protein PRIPAC_94691 [Pristionchus pacificus]|eukprot:PDM67738.1 hypothetical protein PRIPAC_45782 [Pristionchus pacificus]